MTPQIQYGRSYSGLVASWLDAIRLNQEAVDPDGVRVFRQRAKELGDDCH